MGSRFTEGSVRRGEVQLLDRLFLEVRVRRFPLRCAAATTPRLLKDTTVRCCGAARPKTCGGQAIMVKFCRMCSFGHTCGQL